MFFLCWKFSSILRELAEKKVIYSSNPSLILAFNNNALLPIIKREKIRVHPQKYTYVRIDVCALARKKKSLNTQ